MKLNTAVYIWGIPGRLYKNIMPYLSLYRYNVLKKYKILKETIFVIFSNFWLYKKMYTIPSQMYVYNKQFLTVLFIEMSSFMKDVIIKSFFKKRLDAFVLRKWLNFFREARKISEALWETNYFHLNSGIVQWKK